jgi:hypothetical protein
VSSLAPALLRAAGDTASARPKVAAVITRVRYREHGHVVLENFLEPYLFNGEKTDPGVDVVSMYIDQFPPDDMARDISERYKVPIYPTIAKALCLGGDKLAVDAVLSIGEHGDYPKNAKAQVEYPRKRFFDEIVAVFEASGRVAPVFNDKHLSYRWDWAKAMYDTAKRLKIPFMAGSSCPLAERRPPIEVPPGATFRSAISIFGGPLESYDFHGLEVLESMIESRKGGESGVARVQFLDEPALWKAAGEGLWSPRLADLAMACEIGPGALPIRELVASRKLGRPPSRGIQIDYVDGFRALVLSVGYLGSRWNFACEIEGQPEPLATHLYGGPWNNRNLFKALCHAIQVFFREKQAPYPIERTLLTTGILDAAMDSRQAGGKPIETPHLASIRYEPTDWRRFREMGATWKIITDAIPQPKGIEAVLGPAEKGNKP